MYIVHIDFIGKYFIKLYIYIYIYTFYIHTYIFSYIYVDNEYKCCVCSPKAKWGGKGSKKKVKWGGN